MNFKLTKSSLNFKVYTSLTIPSSGTENDIVIISTTPMENWILSSDAPVGEPRNEGDVWIQYSVSGNVFDVMNQHDFMLAITKIYQYINGVWMSVNARRYVGGIWNVVSTAFSATINITYPANSTCIVTNSIGQTVASDANPTSSEKTWTATVNATGTYTVTATATDGSEKSKSQSVSITSEGQFESVVLSYALLLFDGAVTSAAGSFKKLYTSGSTGLGSPTETAVSPSGGKLIISGNAYNALYATEKISLNGDYNTLSMECTITGSFDYVSVVGVTTKEPKAVFASGLAAADNFAASATMKAGTYTGSAAIKIPIAEIGSDVYFMLMYYADYNSEIAFDKIQFE